MDGTTDQLVVKSQRGDAQAFGELVRRYERTALSVALGALGCPQAAGDAVQEAFVRAWQRLGTLKEAKGFGPWLVGIVRNLSIDQRRRTIRRKTGELGDLDIVAARPSPEVELGNREVRQQIDAALERLDDTTRCAVVMRYYDGMSSRQIAELLELTPAAVDMRLSRARQELKRLLSKKAEVAGEREVVLE